ncbi:hypothetical protein QRC92_001234 [Vibrio parahaemolyticus]|jgi:hypothetical protein|uniref:hypothetical protein n=1 Tax=Vibrio TaxID=662 RepID=UPI0002C47E3D|nr:MULTISPECIES: hypothetical protein [Vibrio]EKO3839319.1 hypothetical protein [Vibrio harveyi]KIT29973.1 hypothetical protein H323_20280 [Vibrio parahaemolyticus VP766]EGR2770784.1 hypothetical protein [Vibrio parahaemolyticus]EGR2833450.1 hypothetical protein [Vibrio parahaemolyticus]EGR2886033.1 hypothetical protein [Vibrio parahaemolyticus]
MSEFRNRIESQREAVKIVNSFHLYEEPLFSLTEKSINRWVSINQIDPKAVHVNLVIQASKKLFFLANKSQEQVTEDYKKLSKDVEDLLIQISREMSALRQNAG